MLETNEFDEDYEEAVDEAIEEVVGGIVHCLSEELQDIMNKNRMCWVKDWVGRRNNLGASSTIISELAEEDPLEFKKIMRMSVEQFIELLNVIKDKISKTDTVMRNAIPARSKLQVALRFLATGDSYQTLAIMFRIPANTISSFMPDVLKAITTALQEYMKVPQKLEDWLEIQKNFETKWDFPLCCGAIDGKHVAIKRPPGSSSEFYNYKGSYSVILLALVDADYKFLYIDVGTNGRANDGSVFRLSSLKTAMDNNTLNFPNDYMIVGDDAFPLAPNLMKPFSKKNLTLIERIFNYRLSRARRVVENAFGIMAARFRIFRKEIEVDLKTVDLIVQCACTLHNWLRTTSPATYLEREWVDQEDTETGLFHPGKWHYMGTDLPPLRTARSTNTYSKRASEKRKKLAEYFSKEGQVSWQMNAIGM